MMGFNKEELNPSQKWIKAASFSPSGLLVVITTIFKSLARKSNQITQQEQTKQQKKTIRKWV